MTPTPKFGKTALELLEPQDFDLTLFEKAGLEVTGGFLGFGLACTYNWFWKRPLISGIQKHFALGAAGMATAILWRNYKEYKNAERDAILRHYIKLHPDDFPPPERKQYKDVLEEWIPIR